MPKRKDPNPSRAEASWPPVVIAGGYQTGVVLMRNLVRRGLRVYCVEWFRQQPCFDSVYGKSLECPNPDERAFEWLHFMIDLSGTIGPRPVLIPTADQYVSAIGRYRTELQEHFIFSYEAAALQAILANKESQYALAQEHDAPVPRTKGVKCLDDIIEFASVATFPCLFKPLHSRDWAQLPSCHPFHNLRIVLASSASELETKYQLIDQFNPDVVVQEVIEGPDTAKLVYLSCYARDGRRLGRCMVREIRTAPINFGSATLVEPVLDYEADGVCNRFLTGVHYTGICEIELKRDSRDRQLKIIEANPRYSVTADAAPYAGVDIGWLHYLDLIQYPVQPTNQNGRNFRHIVLTADCSVIRSYRAAGLMSWWDIMWSYRPGTVFFDFDIRDWRVTMKTISRIIRLFMGPLLRKFKSKRSGSGRRKL